MQRSFGRNLAISNKRAVNAVHGRTAVYSQDRDVEGTIGGTTARVGDLSRAVDMNRDIGLRKRSLSDHFRHLYIQEGNSKDLVSNCNSEERRTGSYTFGT